MIRAGGVLFVALNTRRIGLLLRSQHVSKPQTWGFCGGKMEPGEQLLKGLSRELREEIGFVPTYEAVVPIDVFQSADKLFKYHSYVVLVKREFIPRINYESGGYGWFNLDCLPKPLHRGTYHLLMDPSFKDRINQIISDYQK